MARLRGAGSRWLLVLALLLATAAQARPERIQAGQTYYSDEVVVHGLIRDIGAEKNYEEIYQFYRYYEVVYGPEQRVATFREYLRGELAVTETYRYSPDGALLERSVKRPGKPDEATPASPDGSGSGASDE